MRKQYTIDFSDEEHDLALGVITKFFNDLGDPNARPMTLPIIAISSNDVTYGQFGSPTGDKFVLAVDIEDFTKGRLKRLTAEELQFLLFNHAVCEKVTHAMINAMAWIKDVERRGPNQVNRREVYGFFRKICEALVESLRMLLVIRGTDQ